MIKDNCLVLPMWDKTTEEWLEARRHSGIGGSEIAAIAGLSQYDSPYSVYSRKVDDIVTFDGNEATDLGHLLEPFVAQKYAIDHPDIAVVEWPVLLKSKFVPWMFANLDYLIVMPSELFPAGEVTLWKSETEPPGILGILECKTSGMASPGFPDAWLAGENSSPIAYQCQCWWYMKCSGIPKAELACLLAGHGMQYRPIEMDQDYLMDLMDLAESFWKEHVVPKVPPPLDGTESTGAILEARYPTHVPDKIVEGGDELRVLGEEFEDAKRTTKEAEERQRGLRSKIVSLIGDAEMATVDGVAWYTYRTTKDTDYLAGDVLKAELPDVWRKYQRTKSGYRVLRRK